jgi:beta-fructofuranosidase
LGLRIEDKWVWDFWLTTHDGRYHVFYLQAPRSLGDPDLRHANATIGHAVSEDLVTWEIAPDALGRGKSGAWDGTATWTGSVVAKGDTWHMFYTGASIQDGATTQQIGSATSSDLMNWTKKPQPVLTADPRWYETHESHEWFEEAWRDPWVFLGPDGLYHALITARVNHGPPDGRGAVGHAVSPDLEEWEVVGPLSDSGEFGHLEVSQIVSVEGRSLLVFSCQGDHVSARRRSRLRPEPTDATYALEVDSLLGPYALGDARPVLSSDYYSGRLIQTLAGDWVWLAFRNLDDEDRFLGELTDPMPIA